MDGVKYEPNENL